MNRPSSEDAEATVSDMDTTILYKGQELNCVISREMLQWTVMEIKEHIVTQCPGVGESAEDLSLFIVKGPPGSINETTTLMDDTEQLLNYYVELDTDTYCELIPKVVSQ